MFVYSHVRVRTFSFSHMYPSCSLSVQWTYLNTCSHAHLDISRASFCTCSDRYQPEHRASGVRPLLWRGLLYYRSPKIVITVDIVKLNEVKRLLIIIRIYAVLLCIKWHTTQTVCVDCNPTTRTTLKNTHTVLLPTSVLYWFLVNDQRDAQILFYVFISTYNSLHRIISSTNLNAQFSLFINNMFVTLLSSTCFEH